MYCIQAIIMCADDIICAIEDDLRQYSIARQH